MSIRIVNRRNKTFLVEDTKVDGVRHRKFTNVELVEDKPESFANFAEEWLDEKQGVVATSTWEGYKVYVEKHFIPYFTDLALNVDEVKPAHIKSYLSYALLNGNRKNGGRLSSDSLKKHRSVLKAMFDDAVLLGKVEYNPVQSVRMPIKKQSVQEKHVASAEEAREIVSLFEGHVLYPLLVVTMYYGLRRSEALGLRWQAIDFERNTLTINHTVVKNLTIVASDRTKTESSHRTYPLIEDVRKVLVEHKESVAKNKEFFGSAYKDSDYVFTWPDGSLIRPDYITKAFQNVLEKAGYPHMRFHDIRHSTASILFESGWSLKDIQMWLRHSDISVTADIYTHVSQAHSDAMSTKLNSMFV